MEKENPSFMKKIIGLDLGTASIGWALIEEDAEGKNPSRIVDAGVRVNPISTDDTDDFKKGKSITLNADRTLKRSMRRNLQRYKLRRAHLIKQLVAAGMVDKRTALAEEGKGSTFQLLALRAKAAREEIALSDFARVLMAINKKRGYKSSRKTKDEGDGQAVDGMQVAKQLHEKGLTPGQWMWQLLEAGKKFIPEFYASDLKVEWQKLWEAQRVYYPEALTPALFDELEGKSKRDTGTWLRKAWNLEGLQLKGTAAEKRMQQVEWRVKGLSEKLELEHLAIALEEIKGQANNSSSYLGKISDRSKKLYFQNLTVGQYLYKQVKERPNARLKAQVFYRQDYLDEFERIWEVQAQNRKHLLTDELKSDLRDTVIFYQRRLKSQKGLIAICELEGHKKTVVENGKEKEKIVGPRVIPRSSPLFQHFKIWQKLNDLRVFQKDSEIEVSIELEHKELLFEELNWTDKLSETKLLQLLDLTPTNQYKTRFKEGIEGNRTQHALLKAYQHLLDMSGHEVNLNKLSAEDKLQTLTEFFEAQGIDTKILYFNPSLEGQALEAQAAYQLWHLLYSFEEDPTDPESKSKFLAQLSSKFGFSPQQAEVLYSVSFQDDYGSLSAKAIKRILPELQTGHMYSLACQYAGYKHSKWLTKEENKNRILKEKLSILAKNSLRNPVVEKILNQMVNTVNALIDEYGKPDAVRIELGRELKKSAKERDEMTKNINKSTREFEAYKKKIGELPPFNQGVRITRNDIIKYRLYLELAANGHKTLYSNTHIPLSKLFTKEFEVEHILPKASIFDDSFSNKTLESHSANLEKGNATAFDYLSTKYGENSEELEAYEERVERVYKSNADHTISKSKQRKLLMKGEDIPDGFIERDMRNTQYIARKAQEMLHEVFGEVMPTTGKVTDVLREDWQLVHVMRELNWEKYKRLGLTSHESNKDGKPIQVIENWSKRNDHRHHAMDAITVAFTRPSHIQYLNFKNARKQENHKQHRNILGIEKKELIADASGKQRFKPPMPLGDLRAQVKERLEELLVSFKAKNKVVTQNINKTKTLKGTHKQHSLTPRGQLHKETIYGSRQKQVSKLEKVGGKFTEETIALVANQKQREALLARLATFNGNPKKAFTGANTLAKNPVYLDEHQLNKLPEKVKLVWFEEEYTIRKEVEPGLQIKKVVDAAARRALETRLAGFGGNAKEAFVNLDENPIWLSPPVAKEHWKNPEKPSPSELGIPLKRVTITGVSNVEPLHIKRNHFGEPLLTEDGQEIPNNWVSTGNNHHVAIFRDAKGKLQEQMVSFFEAVQRKSNNDPIIDKTFNAEQDWEFLFTLKQNECFVFPNTETGFNPEEVDVIDRKYYGLISPNLFRVQKITSKDYFFRHHLETELIDAKETKNVTWKRCGPSGLEGIVKVRLNHLGRIVKVGEY